MALLGVELVKIVGGQLDLRAVQHGEAHAHENVLDLVQGHIHGMLVAQLSLFAGDGHVHRLRLELQLQRGFLQLLGCGLHGGLHRSADLVGQRAHSGALLGGELAHLLQNSGQFSLLAQVFHPQLVQRGGVLDALQSGEGLRTDLC